MPGVLLVSSPAVAEELHNHAAAANRAVAASNGDSNNDREKHPASGAFKGNRQTDDYATGGVWMSCIHPTPDQPAVWQVTFYLNFLAKQNRWPRVRMNIRPSAIAGVAAVVSSNSFFSSTFSLGPSSNTTTVPFSPCT